MNGVRKLVTTAWSLAAAMSVWAAAAFQEARVDGDGVLRWADGSEVAVWGVNYYPPFSLDYHAIKDKGPDHKAVMREDVEQFKMLGVDVIRLHCFDRQISDAEGRFIDNENVELLDYLISLCASNGIQTVLTPIAWWWAKSGDGFSRHHTMKELVGNRELWPVQQRYLREFVAHRNRYTGFTYGEDPAVLFFECINEPLYETNAKDEDVTAYADALASAIRTGTKKPVFFNSWCGKNKAVGASGVDGITGSCYPTGLLAGHELAGPHLAALRESTLKPDDSVVKKAKAIYEFDAADTEGAYFYPAFARLFRHEGAQMAAMFQYDPTALADENLNWQTHHLNLVWTPRKAVSFLIGGEAFRRLKRGCAFSPSEREMSFAPFKVDSLLDLSEMATETDYLYSTDPVTPPPAPEKLRRVVGTGRSPVAASSGTGAYFLLKESSGVWTLDLFESVFQAGNPFDGNPGAKVAKSTERIALAVHLPDLGERFVVRGRDGRKTIARAVEGRVKLSPGKYRLVRSGISGDRPEDIDFLDVGDALGYASWKHGLSKSKWITLQRGTDDLGRPSLVSTVKKGAFADEFPAEYLRLYRDPAPLKWHFPGMGAGKAIRIRARATNPNTQKVEIALIMPGGYAWGTNIPLSQEWRQIEIPVERLRYFTQWGKSKPDGLEFDLGRVEAVNFCLGRWLLGDCKDVEHGFEVSSIRPLFGEPDWRDAMPWRLDRPLELSGMRGFPCADAKGGQILKADGFFPFVDKYGQFIHDDWKGKVHSDMELQAHRRKEERWLERNAAGPRNDLDRFGGWLGGPQLKATGFFRAEKAGGKWWLVDPEGRLFFSHGVNCVGMNEVTGVKGREKYFAETFGKTEKISFAEENRKRKFGEGWRRKSAELAHRRLKAWGFNTVANWSEPDVAFMRRTPYTANISTAGTPRLEGSTGWWGPLPDPFAPEFEATLRKRVKALAAKIKDDPWCLGVFVDNELSWNWEPRMKRIAAKYFEVVSSVLKEEMPNHLYLGCRLAWGCDEVFEEAAKHCDVVSVNVYERRFSRELPPGATDKPLLVGEFHFGATDRGMFHPGLVGAENQEERSALYRAYMRDCLESPRCVGAHWFQYQDEPLTGRFDGENYQIGFVSVADAPYPEIVSAARCAAAEMYERRFGEKK